MALEIRDVFMCRGATKAARELGVCYTHLWKVLKGKYDSPSLVLKIRDRCPVLFKSSMCNIDYLKIIKDAQKKYVWDEEKQRYSMKKKTNNGK